MSERFFSSNPVTTDEVTLDGAEAHHLLHVMRAQVGERVTIFDDSGWEFTAAIVERRRSEVSLQVLERQHIDRELTFPLTLGVALPKGDRQKWLVEKLTELGVTALVPLDTERGVAQPTAGALDRLRRAGIEAAKQCGRNRLMRIAAPQTWPQWLAGGHADGERGLVAHPGGRPISQLDLSPSRAMRLSIGPEGGLTDYEVAKAVEAGWQSIDLGPRVLRVETAAVAMAAAITLR